MLKKLDVLNPADYTVEERRELVAKAIEQEPERFDMSIYGNWECEKDCGTVGCIAGWTVWLFAREHYNTKDFSLGLAAELLGLDRDPAENLFYAHWCPGGISRVTPAQAAAKLREHHNV